MSPESENVLISIANTSSLLAYASGISLLTLIYITDISPLLAAQPEIRFGGAQNVSQGHKGMGVVQITVNLRLRLCYAFFH